MPGVVLWSSTARRRVAPVLAGLALLLSTATPLGAQIRFWVDERGVTHFTDEPAGPVGEATGDAEDAELLRRAWSDGITARIPIDRPSESSGEGSRIRRLLGGAVADIDRGELSRADATLRGVLRISPRQPEAHWLLATLARNRGRVRAAEEHLRRFLDSAGPELAPWREAAQSRIQALEDERRLADPAALDGPLELVEADAKHFRLEFDTRLGDVSPDFAARVLGDLREAREVVSGSLGVAPSEPLGVVLYAKAAYVRAHAHRFSFQTIGFFDGRIHVASPAHLSEALRGVLFHEYTHAVFREQTGGDRPYWLNEGLAEQVERRARGRSVSTRSERAALRANLETHRWIPLRSIAHSFSGLSDDTARDAYLESVVTAAYIDSQTTLEQRRRLFSLLGEGLSIDQALHRVIGLDTDSLERAVQAELRDEFPEWTLPAAEPPTTD